MKEIPAIITATLVAPVVPATVLTASVLFNSAADKSSFSTFFGAFVFSYIYSANAGVVLGLPVFFLLRYLKLASWWSAVIAGSCVGILVAVIFPRGVFSAGAELFLDVFMGITAALLFWLIWQRSQPRIA
jgi:hypothetical protein